MKGQPEKISLDAIYLLTYLLAYNRYTADDSEHFSVGLEDDGQRFCTF